MASVTPRGRKAVTERLPRVSVCIPTYNGAASLERCLGSVLEQHGSEPGDVEIVLTDDRSSDTTSTILERFGRLPAVRAYSNSRRLGLTANWHRALSLARGDVATVLHQDDWYEPGCLPRVIEVFDRDPRVAFAAFGQIVHRLDERGIVFRPRARVGTFTGAEYAEYCLGFQECPAPSTAFVRRDRLRGFGVYYDPRYRYCSELDFYIRLAVANRDHHFVHDARLLVHRGTAQDRFSFRYPGYRVLDLCKIHLRHRDHLRVADARRRAAEQLRRRIASDLRTMFCRRDPKQMVTVLSDMHFLRWVLRGPQNMRVVLRALGSAVRAAFKSGRTELLSIADDKEDATT